MARYKDPSRQTIYARYLEYAADPSSPLYDGAGRPYRACPNMWVAAFWAGYDGLPVPRDSPRSKAIQTARAAGVDYYKATRAGKHGGARPGAGRKATDGATGLEVYSVGLPPAVAAWAHAAGPARIREVLAAAKEQEEVSK